MVIQTSEHTVSSFDEELVHLAQSIAEMGGLVESAISDATNALVRLDHPVAREVIARDKKIDEMQHRVDEMAVSMIARRQPMADDLRLIIASIHVANDLERVGDMAKTICRRTLQIEEAQISPKLYNGIRHMSDMVLGQIKTALDAFATRDDKAALEVCRHDDEVDAMYNSLFRELLTYMMEDPRNITACTNLLFCGKSLERTGDHATNIAEQAFYVATGRAMVTQHEDIRTQPKI
ncbi:MAG TPA: phosphate signaling complex protein PhoU [Devosiaceae bacterium]